MLIFKPIHDVHLPPPNRTKLGLLDSDRRLFESDQTLFRRGFRFYRALGWCAVVVFIILLSTVKGIAQEPCILLDSFPPGPQGLPAAPRSTPCFDPASVMENETPIYIRLRIHLFLDDDCEGSLIVGPGENQNLDPGDAWQIAETLVDDANAFFETIEGQENWANLCYNLPEQYTPHFPVRYILSGVNIHCSSYNANLDGKIPDLYVDPETEIQVYLGDVTLNGGSPNGYTWLHEYRLAIENLSPQNINHELGHCFGLDHSFEFDDGCTDTWYNSWTWDKNGDNIPDDVNKKCWDATPHDKSDPNNNGIVDGAEDYCDELYYPGNPHPCCDWCNQTNNMMAHSAWGANPTYSALTECQANRMLGFISTEKCDYIAQIGGDCPPPGAAVGVLPTVSGTMNCPTCFHLEASDNETSYRITLMNNTGNIILQTSQLPGQAGKYCLKPKTVNGNTTWPYGLQAGTTYKFKLEVFNDCSSTDEEIISFVLPSPCSGSSSSGPGLSGIGLAPNPLTGGTVTVSLDATDGGPLLIYGQHATSSASYGMVDSRTLTSGTNTPFTLTTTSWQSGANLLFFVYAGQLWIETVIKP